MHKRKDVLMILFNILILLICSISLCGYSLFLSSLCSVFCFFQIGRTAEGGQTNRQMRTVPVGKVGGMDVIRAAAMVTLAPYAPASTTLRS